MTTGNLFQDAAPPLKAERFDTLLKHRNLVIERIVSSAATTPHEPLQSQDEWLLLARGTAKLEINGTLKKLEAGEYVFLPAGTPHSVTQTSEGALLLAVHLHCTRLTASPLHHERYRRQAIRPHRPCHRAP